MQAGLAQAALDVRVALFDRRLVAAGPQHRPGAGARGQRLQRGERRPARQQQPRTAPLQFFGERRQGAPAPRARRRAGRPVAFLLRGVDVDRQRPQAAVQRRAQGRVVIQAQIVAQPDQCDAHGYTVPRLRPIHGRYQRRTAAMSAASSPLVWNGAPKPMTLSG